jgi:hypothetical protein
VRMRKRLYAALTSSQSRSTGKLEAIMPDLGAKLVDDFIDKFSHLGKAPTTRDLVIVTSIAESPNVLRQVLCRRPEV